MTWTASYIICITSEWTSRYGI